MITTREILSIACKIWGLYHLMWGVTICLSLIPQVVMQGLFPNSGLLGQLGIGVFHIVIPLGLIIYSEGIALFLVKEDRSVQMSLGEDWQRPLFRLCLRVAGVIVLVQAIPELMEQLSLYAFFRHATPAVPIPAAIWSELLGAVIYLLLGGYLLGGGHYIVKFTERESAGPSR